MDVLKCRTRVSDITDSEEGKGIKVVNTAVGLASLGVSTIKTVLDEKVKNRYTIQWQLCLPGFQGYLWLHGSAVSLASNRQKSGRQACILLVMRYVIVHGCC